MTREQADAKAAASGGTLVAEKDASKPGGWRARSRVAKKAVNARYRASEKGKAKRAWYAASEKGKAARGRYNASEGGKARNAWYEGTADRKARNTGPDRRASAFRQRTGAAVTAADITALRERQGGVCPITKKPLTEIRAAIDHAHGEEHLGAKALRGVIQFGWNSLLGRTDAELFAFAQNLSAYAGQRKRVLIRRRCPRATP